MNAGTDPEPDSGWILCRAADALDGETIAHVVNRAALGDGPRDVAIVLWDPGLPERWCDALRAVVASESTAATASALTEDAVTLDAAPALELIAIELPAGTGAPAPAPPQLGAPVAVPHGPVVYLARAAFELLDGLDESLLTSAGAVADFALRAQRHGFSNLAAGGLLYRRHDGNREEQELARDLPELEHRHGRALAAAADLPGAAIERARARARLARGRLTVTFDARALGRGSSGTEVYTEQLLRALAASGEVSLRALVGEETALPADLLESATIEPLTYSQALQEPERTDLVHRPQQVFTVDDLTLLRPLGARLVLTQLDLISYHNPLYFEDLHAWRSHVRAVRIAMQLADRTIFLSRHALADAAREDLVEQGRASVVAPGTDHSAPAPAASRAPAALDGRPGPFLLCIGSDYMHKNRPFAMRLLQALGEQHGWTGSLVLAGPHITSGSSAEEERQLLYRSPLLADRTLDLGRVSEGEREWLLARTAAVVYPSVTEGFGLIPFEAAHAGVPCLFAPQAALGETLPCELATIQPWDAPASAAAALKLLCDGAERGAHVARLREISRAYSWEACAQATLAAYAATIASPARASARAAWEAQERELEIVRLDREIRDVGAAMQAFVDDLGPDGLALIGSRGTLTRADQRALLALTARPPLKTALFGSLRAAYSVLHRRAG